MTPADIRTLLQAVTHSSHTQACKVRMAAHSQSQYAAYQLSGEDPQYLEPEADTFACDCVLIVALCDEVERLTQERDEARFICAKITGTSHPEMYKSAEVIALESRLAQMQAVVEAAREADSLMHPGMRSDKMQAVHILLKDALANLTTENAQETP